MVSAVHCVQSQELYRLWKGLDEFVTLASNATADSSDVHPTCPGQLQLLELAAIFSETCSLLLSEVRGRHNGCLYSWISCRVLSLGVTGQYSFTPPATGTRYRSCRSRQEAGAARYAHNNFVTKQFVWFRPMHHRKVGMGSGVWERG